MKNKIKFSILGLGILFGSAVFAQETKQLSQKKVMKEQHMEKRMDHFGEKMELTADQKAKITEIRKNSALERQKIKDDAVADKTKKAEAFQAIYTKERTEIGKILTPEQSLKWEKMQNDRGAMVGKKDYKYPNKGERNEKFRGDRKSGKSQYKESKRQNKLIPAKE